uniref:EF-hand domain-containing protein n=1 Tax=Ditylenchus dipsaci TaxID=166011 RepID=A0A915DBM7_9BILA
MTLLLFLLTKVDLNISASTTYDTSISRTLHILFQADSNHDRYLDKEELDKFVEVFTKRMAALYTKAKVTKDTIEGAKIIAKELMKRRTENMFDKLSFRGNLLRNSDATNFGVMLEKVIVNLVHEINGLQPPYPAIKPFVI